MATALLVTACTGSDDVDDSPATDTTAGTTSIAPDPTLPTDRTVPGATTAASVSTLPPPPEPLEGTERELALGCITALYTLPGPVGDDFATVSERCNEAAATIGDASSNTADLRGLLLVAERWVNGVIDPISYHQQFGAIYDDLAARNRPDVDLSLLSREGRAAVLGCTDALSTGGAVVRADLASFGDRTALDTAIAACDLAHTQVDVDNLDGPGFSPLGLLALDLSTINFVLTSAAVDLIAGQPPTVDSFDAYISPAVDRINARVDTLTAR